MAKREARFNSILQSTCATIFMGVPHDSADIAQLSKRVGCIAQAYFDLSPTTLKELVRDSRPLQGIARAFGEIEGFSVVTVTESDKTFMPSKKSVLVSTKPFRKPDCYLGKALNGRRWFHLLRLGLILGTVRRCSRSPVRTIAHYASSLRLMTLNIGRWPPFYRNW